MPSKVLIIAIGNEFREDDGIGPVIVRAMKENMPDTFDYCESNGEATRLIELWKDIPLVAIVDAMQVDSLPAGTMKVFYPLTENILLADQHQSSHGFSVNEALELGKILDRLPHKIIVFSIQGEKFKQRNRISDTLKIKIPSLVSEIANILKKELQNA
jgi:hydrogenase maturation protease